jgi:hypothetical protein
MASNDPRARGQLDLREQIARIDNLLIDTQKKQREFHLAPWQVFATVLTIYTGALAAGAALGLRLFGR